MFLVPFIVKCFNILILCVKKVFLNREFYELMEQETVCIWTTTKSHNLW